MNGSWMEFAFPKWRDVNMYKGYSLSAFDWQISIWILKTAFRMSHWNTKSKNGFWLTEILLRDGFQSFVILRFFCEKNLKKHLQSCSREQQFASSSRKVSHEWLATLLVNNRTNDRNNDPTLKNNSNCYTRGPVELQAYKSCHTGGECWVHNPEWRTKVLENAFDSDWNENMADV